MDCDFYRLPFIRSPLCAEIPAPQRQNISTNIDALIGREGKVEEAIAPGESGYVAVDGDVWKAVSRETDVIEVGEKVKIVDRKSLIVTVERN